MRYAVITKRGYLMQGNFMKTFASPDLAFPAMKKGSQLVIISESSNWSQAMRNTYKEQRRTWERPDLRAPK